MKAFSRRIIGAYASAVVSISLVLFLIGVASLLVVNARAVSDYFKESLQVSVLLKAEATDAKAEKLKEEIVALPFVKSARVVTKEEGEQDLKKMLGEDFLSVFETSPVPVSIDVSLTAEYVSPDSLDVVTAKLSEYRLVDEVSTQRSLVEALNSNIAKIGLGLGVLVLMLLFISFVLIGNTVRLNIFSKRFTIHTMQLVGADRFFIIRPFLVSSVWEGLAGALLSLILLGTILAVAWKSFPQIFEVVTAASLATVALVVVLSGILICLVSTYFTVGRLITLSKDDLYV